MKQQIECSTGFNFTKYEFDTKEELREFIDDNKMLFRFVGYCASLTANKNGKFTITF